MRSISGMLRLGAVLLYASAELVLRRPATRGERAMWLHRLCLRAMRRFGIEVRLSGRFPERGVLIANHLSYLDIVVFASLGPCVFVSKAEIAGWPLLGWMTTMAGTVYVNRGKRGSAQAAGSGMLRAAESGLPVVFFPEGTTSNGEGILRFHSGLLTEALQAEQPITPAFLRYSLLRNEDGVDVRDDVAYWGERPMLPHVFRFLSLRGVRAEVVIGDGPVEFGPVRSRKMVAVEARRAVCRLSEGCAAAAEPFELAG